MPASTFGHGNSGMANLMKLLTAATMPVLTKGEKLKDPSLETGSYIVI